MRVLRQDGQRYPVGTRPPGQPHRDRGVLIEPGEGHTEPWAVQLQYGIPRPDCRTCKRQRLPFLGGEDTGIIP